MGANPVPPVVRIRSICLPSARRISWFFRGWMPSGSRRVSSTRYPASVSILAIRGPERSSLSPLLPLSESVITAARRGGFSSGGSSASSSPTDTFPPFNTRAKTPSLGMIQSPVFCLMIQSLWHSLPICVISSTASPVPNRLPTGKFRKSRPSTTRFSPNAPYSTHIFFRNSSILSPDRRLTCLCQFPPCASPSSPKPSTSIPEPTFSFGVPFSLLIQTALIFPIPHYLLSLFYLLSSGYKSSTFCGAIPSCSGILSGTRSFGILHHTGVLSSFCPA